MFIITTLAGTGSTTFSGDGGAATAASVYSPYYVAVDAAGNVYFPDRNSRVRKITVSTGLISTIAGTGTSSFSGDNGQATAATLSGPGAIALDASGTS